MYLKLKEYFPVKMSESLRCFESYMTSNCYVVVPQNNSSICYIIDLPPDYQKAMDYISEQNLTIGGVLLTHGHFDHTLGINTFDGKVYINLKDEFLARNPQEQLKSFLLDEDSTLEAYSGKLYDIFDHEIDGLTIYNNPGHTKGSTSFYFEAIGSVFTGDFIFADGIGRTDLYSGSPSEMKESVNKVFMSLDEELNILPGHGKSDSVKNILKYNRYLWELIND